jgi:hypothetical protein
MAEEAEGAEGDKDGKGSRGGGGSRGREEVLLTKELKTFDSRNELNFLLGFLG